jgi:lipopolysaccharide export system protein LptC
MTNTAAPRSTSTRRTSTGPSEIGISGNSRGEDAFVNAERHSRRVRALKLALPVLGGAIAVGFTGYSYLVTPPSISVDVAGAAIRDGKLVMANPKLDGFTKDKLPYSMSAMRAIQDMADTEVIALEQIDATFPVSETNSAKVNAPSGVYNQAKDTLDITSQLTITTSDGMVARFKSAFLDVATGRLTSSEPVDIRTIGSHITADSMMLSEGGKVIVFEDRVRVQIDREKLTTAQRGNEGADVHN